MPVGRTKKRNTIKKKSGKRMIFLAKGSLGLLVTTEELINNEEQN